MDLDAKNQALLTKGRKDETSVAEISVTIRYTPQFANTLGVFYPDGLLMVAAWTIDVILSKFFMIDSRLDFSDFEYNFWKQ